MGFILKQLNGGNKLEADSTGGGNIEVISGKGKPASIKAWKDEGTVKKGDTIEGIEFIVKCKNRGNVVAQTYDKDTKKFVPSAVPVAETFDATIFLGANNGLAYKMILSSLEESRKIGILPAFDGLPADDKTPLLIDGFSGIIFVGNSAEIDSVIAGDYKPERVKMFLFDEFQPKACTLEFAASKAPYSGGSSSQAEKDKLSDRVNFIQAVLTDASIEQQIFVKLLAIDGTITHKEFISLMFR
jgi:hypothetical protein